MRQFFKDLGISDPMKYIRLSNTFNMLTVEEKVRAIMQGIEAFPEAELTVKQVWIYYNSYLKEKEQLETPVKTLPDDRDQIIINTAINIIKNNG